MRKPARVSLEAGIRTELFRDYLSEVLGASELESDYQEALHHSILDLGRGIGRSLGLPISPLSTAPAGLIEACSPSHLGELYQQALEHRPQKSNGKIHWERNSEGRRKSGTYYTPSSLIDPILDFTLSPLLGTDSGPKTICDPSCGSGAFLMRACTYMSEHTGAPMAEVAASSIYGCDIDSTAVEIARLQMWFATGSALPSENLQCADSLTADWTELYPTIFQRGGFDAIIGNPPFGGVVEGRVSDAIKSQRSGRFAKIGGTADLSYYFAALAVELIQPCGRVGLVLPRAFLSASSASNLRRPSGRRLHIIHTFDRHDAFAGAAIHVCLIGFDDSVQTQNAEIATPTRGGADTGLPDTNDGLTLKVTASLIVDEAYRIASKVFDSREGDSPKLLTTGLIEPGASLWGIDLCRFLKSKYRHPRVPLDRLSLRRQEMARKPKLLVAGLSKQIESLLDATGEYAGSVGTYTITHPENDLSELTRAMNYLHSEPIRQQFVAELGPTALGGGNITVTKRFLKQVLAQGKF